MDWERLTGLQLGVICDEFLDAFPNNFDFDTFLRTKMNKRNLASIARGDTFGNQMFNLIERAHAEGWLERMVAAAQSALPERRRMRALPDIIRLAGVPELIIQGQAMSLQRIVRGSGFANVARWLDKFVRICEATCRIEFPEGEAQATGILVGKDRILTNYHVVEGYKGRTADDLVCRFDYGSDVAGTQAGSVSRLRAGRDWCLASSPYDTAADGGSGGIASPDSLDFALLQLSAAAPKTADGNDRAFISLGDSVERPIAGGNLLIVQHPMGTPLAIAFGQSLGFSEDHARLRYDADTVNGSSGSGVFNQELDIVALHQAGDSRSRIRAGFNQGIPIGLIVAMIAKQTAGALQ